MPMPSPRAGEAHDAFLSRFHEKMANEFPDSKQRHAIGEKQWREARKDENGFNTGFTVGGPGHEHRYQVNDTGAGRTGADEGHHHEIKAFMVIPAADHGHALDRVFQGFIVEAEHGIDPVVRLKTTIDHLREHADYYDRLEAAGL